MYHCQVGERDIVYLCLFCRPHPKIPAEIRSTMRMTKFVGHAARPPWLLRNQCPYVIPPLAGQLPMSSANEDMMTRGRAHRIIATPHVTDAPPLAVSDPPSPVPTFYQPVQIKYSKLGE